MDRNYGTLSQPRAHPPPHLSPSANHTPIDPLLRRGNRQDVYVMGARGAGKTSVISRVFKGMPPREALFLRPSRESQSYDFSVFTDIRLMDYKPTQQPGERPRPFEGVDFRTLSALIIVFDIRSDRQYASISEVATAFVRAHRANEAIQLHMFLHKADDKSDITKEEESSEIKLLVNNAIQNIYSVSTDRERPLQISSIQFHLTSVEDTTCHAAFSKVIERIVPQRVSLQRLLDVFVSNSQLLRAFVFNTTYNLFVGMDTNSPFDTLTFDMLMQYLILLKGFRAVYQLSGPPSPQALTASTSTLVSQESPESSSRMRMTNGSYLLYYEIEPGYALVAWTDSRIPDKKLAAVDSNAEKIRKAVGKILEIERSIKTREFESLALSRTGTLNHLSS